MYLYDAPIIFYALWRMVQPFIDPVTKEKVTFVSGQSAVKEFQAVYPPDVSSLALYDNVLAA